MSGTVSDQVIAIIAAKALLAPAEVRVDATLEELGLDSLGLVEAIFAIEETFDISVPFNPNDPPEDAMAGAAVPAFDTTTVARVIAGIEALIAQQAA